MNPHDFLSFFLVLILVSCCCTVSHGQMPSDCCLEAHGEAIPKKLPLVDYRHQIAGSGCRISAIVFVCRSGAKLCYATNAPNVQKAMKRVDRLKNFCRNTNYEDQHCLGVPPM
ncbi:C-C motif chemokine 19-like [Syngnathus scovelli]|uniref:C-C motif chemokine 19-like n=1 Tax=Syngnathus scovelli TaxID=161590 RepID=UPI0035CA5065